MQAIFIDMLPILLFFIAYKLYGIYIATATCIVVMLLQMLYSLKHNGKIPSSQLILLATVCVLGGATLWFKNEMFIKWKPTVVYWVFSLAFLLSPYFLKTTLIQKMLGAHVSLLKQNWKRLNGACALFLLIMGAINLWVVYHFNTDTWVNYKLFGTIILTLAFAISISAYVSRHALPDSSVSQ